MVGPDHKASLEPDELSTLVHMIRNVDAALGDGIKRPMPCELDNKSRMQKSLIAKRSIQKGELIYSEDLTAKRPATGLPPSWFDRVIGKRASKDIAADEILTMASLDWKG
jgi:sialic acid synthase SpsE